MIQQEVLSRNVDVDHPTEFCENKDANLMLLLKHNYVGRCINNAYVISIDRIIVASNVTILKSSGGETGSMSVRFVATVARYQKGGIVSGCKVDETVGNNIKLSHPHIVVVADATYKHTKLGLISMSMFSQGLMIPMSINVITSMPNDPKLIARGTLYIPAACSYRLIPDGDIDSSQIESLIDAAAKAEADVKALASHPRYTFFKDILYPFTKDREQEIDRTRQHSVVNVARNMTDIKNKRIVFDARTHWSMTPYITVEPADVDTNPPNLGGAYPMTAHQIMVQLLSDYVSHAHLFIDMVKRYETEEVFRAHAPLWNIMNQAKTD